MTAETLAELRHEWTYNMKLHRETRLIPQQDIVRIIANSLLGKGLKFELALVQIRCRQAQQEAVCIGGALKTVNVAVCTNFRSRDAHGQHFAPLSQKNERSILA